MRVLADEAGARHGRARLVVSGALALALLFASGCGARVARPAARRVEIRQLAFDPADLAAAPGDTVIWANQDIVPHTATSAAGGWDTGRIGPDSSARVVLAPGSFGPYVCAYHPSMKGTITRSAAGARPAASPHRSE